MIDAPVVPMMEDDMMEPEAFPVEQQGLAPSPVSPTGLPEPERIGPTSVDLTEDEKVALKYIKDTITEPDDEIRERMVPIWQMYENYWRGLQDVVWDASLGAFVNAAGVLKRANELDDSYIGSKVVNTYRAHGESVAAALSAGTPQVKFYPEDADDPQDITTAKTYSVASEYIADDNNSKLLHLRAIYTRWNQPFVAYYNTYVYDEQYGTTQKNEYGYQEIDEPEAFCPSCGEDLPVQTPNAMCPDCGVEAKVSSYTKIEPTVERIVEIPKGKEIIEVYGPRHVRVPYNITKLKQAGYLILETEHHWAELVSIFPQLEGEITSGSPAPGTQTTDISRRHRRALEGSDPDRDQQTLERCWLRKWTFNLINDEEIRASLKVKFPNGVQASFCDDKFVEAFNESMDDHWTLVPDPFAEHIHGDPYGKPMIPVQDMENDTVQLTLETILFSIPDRYADPQVLNFQQYKNTEKGPGQVFPAKRPSGMNLSAGFFDGNTATLSDNVEVFRQALQHYGMLVTGDFPGIHGGPLPKGSSRTADEYRQAKQSAMQRLSIIWLVVNMAWSEVMKKSVNELRRHMNFQGEDIKFVKEAGKGFTNVWIKLSDISDGEVGRVRPETAETFPLSTEQQRGALLELIGTGNPQIFQWLFSPENLGEFSRVLIGLNKFKVTGEEQREYQLWEINNILTGVPAQVTPDLDNHALHIAIIQEWATSEDGRKTQEVNPQGWAMVMQHLQQHSIILQSQMAQQQMQQQQAGGQRGPSGQAEETGAAEPPA